MWLTDFKKALILEDFGAIEKLLNSMPRFESLEEMESAAYLFIECNKMLEKKKIVTAHSMQQIKHVLEFLKSSEPSSTTSLDIKF
ncbi:MAG: hypothetical protein AB7S65_02460 [Sulfuricurvum sp.]